MERAFKLAISSLKHPFWHMFKSMQMQSWKKNKVEDDQVA